MTDTTKKATAKKASPAKKSAAKAPAAKKDVSRKPDSKKTATPSAKSTPKKATVNKTVKKTAVQPTSLKTAQVKAASAKPTKTQRVEAKREADKVIPAVRDELTKNAAELKATTAEAFAPENRRGKLDLVLVAPRTVASKALNLGASSVVFVATTAAKPVRKLLPR